MNDRTATEWLISPRTTSLLAQFRAEDRAATLASIPASDADAALMSRLALNRKRFPRCREHWRRAFIGLSLEEAWGGGVIDMGPDQLQHERTHPGCGNSWSGD